MPSQCPQSEPNHIAAIIIIDMNSIVIDIEGIDPDLDIDLDIIVPHPDTASLDHIPPIPSLLTIPMTLDIVNEGEVVAIIRVEISSLTRALRRAVILDVIIIIIISIAIIIAIIIDREEYVRSNENIVIDQRRRRQAPRPIQPGRGTTASPFRNISSFRPPEALSVLTVVLNRKSIRSTPRSPSPMTQINDPIRPVNNAIYRRLAQRQSEKHKIFDDMKTFL